MNWLSVRLWISCLLALALFGCSSESTPTAGSPEAPSSTVADSATSSADSAAAEMEQSMDPAMEAPAEEAAGEAEMPASETASYDTAADVTTGEEEMMAAAMESPSSDPAMMETDPAMMETDPAMMESDPALMESDPAMMESIADTSDSFNADGSKQADAQPEPEPLPSDYLSQAKLAFSAGMEDRAYDLLMAHLVAEPELAASSQTYQQVGWSALNKRPTWGMRIGLGVNTAAVKHSGNMHPVRENMKEPKEALRNKNGAIIGDGGGGGFEAAGQAEMGTEMGSEMGGGASAADLSGPEAEIDRYVGLVGTIALDMFADRFSSGDFGKIFSSLSAVETVEEDSLTGRTGSDESGETMNTEIESAEMAAVTESDPAMSDPAMSDPAMTEGELSESNPGRTPSGGGIGGFADGSSRVRPGLHYLGVGRPAELLEQAKAAGLDAYLQIDVSVVKNEANGWVYNDSSMRWMLVSTGRAIGRSSKKINNKAVQQAMESRKLDPNEIVRDELTGVFAGGMEELKLKPMPELNASSVMSRVGALILSPPENRLEALAEVRLYESQGLMTEEQVHLAFDLLMGDDGLILSAGPLEERIELIEPNTPKLTSY